MDDFQILQTAINEDRILTTFDHHFGDWVILPLNEHAGVIRLQEIFQLKFICHQILQLLQKLCFR